MVKKNWKISSCFFIVSVSVFLYLIFILLFTQVEPFELYHGPWYTSMDPLPRAPGPHFLLRYFFMSVPVLIGYAAFTMKIIPRVHGASMAYPIAICNLLIGLNLSLRVHFGISFYTVFSEGIADIIIFAAVLVASFIFGVVKDITYIRNNKRAEREAE